MGVRVGPQTVVEGFLRAQHALVVREVESSAVDDRRRPPVEQVRVAATERYITRLDPVVAGVRPHDDREGQADRRGADDPLPSAGPGDDREQDPRDDEDDADRPHRRGQPEQRAADREEGEGQRALPEQQHDRAEDQCLEQHLRHDVLLDLELVRVEQDGDDSEHSNPTPDAEADEQGVDRDAHGQPDDVLDRGDDREVAHGEHRPQQENDVAERLRGLRGVEVVQVPEVPVGVDVQQRGSVGDLRHDPQRNPDAQHGQEHPMSSRSEPQTSCVPPRRTSARANRVFGSRAAARAAVYECSGRQ